MKRVEEYVDFWMTTCKYVATFSGVILEFDKNKLGLKI